MDAIKSLNLFIIFILEIALLTAFGEAGLNLQAPLFVRILVALLLVGITIFIWSTWLAPRAKHRLEIPLLVVAKSILFILATVTLYLDDQRMAAFSIITAFVLSESLALAWGQENPSAHGE